MALTPEEQAELQQLEAEEQARAEDMAKNYVPTEEDKKEADRISGIDETSGLQRFIAGGVTSGLNLLKAPGRIATQVAGSEEANTKQQKAIDLENRLSEHLGTAGKVGKFAGDVAQGFVPGLAGASLLAKGALAKGIIGGVTGGAIGGALQPVGTGDSALVNTATGAIAGGTLGGVGAAALKGVNALRNGISKDKAVQDIFNQTIAGMDDGALQSLDALTTKLGFNRATQQKFTPTIGLQLATQKSPQVRRYVDQLRKLDPEQQKNDLQILSDVSQTFPMDKVLKNQPVGSVLKAYEDVMRADISKKTAPMYEQLKTVKAPMSLNQAIAQNPSAKGVLQEVMDDPSITNQVRDELASLMPSKYGAQATDPTLATYNSINAHVNNELQLLEKNKARGLNFDQSRINQLRQVKQTLAPLQSDEMFRGVAQAYQDAKAPLNNLYQSEVYKSWTKNKTDKAFDTAKKTPSSYGLDNIDAKQLANDLHEFNPNMYHNVVASKVGRALEDISSGRLEDKEVIKVLGKIQDLASQSPEQKLLVNIVKEAHNKATETPGRLQLIAALNQDRNRQAFMEVLGNPDRYRDALRQALRSADKNTAILNLVSNIAGGGAGLATASPDVRNVTTLGAANALGNVAGAVGGAAGMAGRLFR